jgi:membrane protease subunit HflC
MTASWLRSPIGIAVAVILLLVVIMSTIAIVPESKQVVILRLEQPLRTINAYRAGEQFGRTQAGPIFRIPFIDRVVWVDKRVLDIDLPNQPVLSTDQLRLEVDAYARFRVVDPLRMVVTVGYSARRCATNSASGRRPLCSAPSAAR